MKHPVRVLDSLYPQQEEKHLFDGAENTMHDAPCVEFYGRREAVRMNLFIQGWRVAEIKSVKEVKRDARDIRL